MTKNNNTCMIISIIIAAVVVGVLAYFIGTVAPLWIAVLAFLVLLFLGLWLAQKICGGETGSAAVAPAATVAQDSGTDTPVEAPAAPEPAQADEKPLVTTAEGETLADLADSINADTPPEPAAEPSAPEAGARPAALSEARDGKGDDLKKIKGVGPKMEKMLNEMGFFHFDQIAAWTEAEVAWVDENLQGFKGRVTRDNWVEQAKTLAEGGETAFSKKVDKGGVY